MSKTQQLLSLIKEIGLYQLLTFADGSINISADGAAMLKNFDEVTVTRDEDKKISKVVVAIDNITMWGFITDNDYIKYLESKVK